MPSVSSSLAHRVDERAAELAEARRRAAAASRACGSRPVERSRHPPDLLHAELPGLRDDAARARSGRAPRPVRWPWRPLAEDGHPGAQVRARLEVARAAPRRARVPCRRCGSRPHARPATRSPSLPSQAGSSRRPPRPDGRGSAPSRESETTTLPWLRIVGGIGSGCARRGPSRYDALASAPGRRAAARRAPGVRRRAARAGAGRSPPPRAGASPAASPSRPRRSAPRRAARRWPGRSREAARGAGHSASPAGPAPDDADADLDRVSVARRDRNRRAGWRRVVGGSEP